MAPDGRVEPCGERVSGGGQRGEAVLGVIQIVLLLLPWLGSVLVLVLVWA